MVSMHRGITEGRESLTQRPFALVAGTPLLGHWPLVARGRRGDQILP